MSKELRKITMGKMMEVIESMNNLDRENDYFITKKAGDYILVKVDKNGYAWRIGFANCELMIRKVIMDVYDELCDKLVD